MLPLIPRVRRPRVVLCEVYCGPGAGP